MADNNKAKKTKNKTKNHKKDDKESGSVSKKTATMPGKNNEMDHKRKRNQESESINKKNKNTIVTDERFASVHYDPKFQRVPRKESKVVVDKRFERMFKDESFGNRSKVRVDKRGKRKEKDENSSLSRYYLKEEEEEESEDEERDSEEDESESEMEESSSSDEDEDDDDDMDIIQSDVGKYLVASQEDTPRTEQDTCRLAIVNMDWDHIKAVDLYVVISSCLPKNGQLLSVGIYPTDFGLKCMEVEAVSGPNALLNKTEDQNDDESESEDENVINEKVRTYELNKLRYYNGVAVFDSSATASHVYGTLDGTELLRTSNFFDLRVIPDSVEFKHPPRDIVTEAPICYIKPDFHTRALQHTNVELTWDKEPKRAILERKHNVDKLDDLEEYMASSDDSDDDDDNEEENNGTENSKISKKIKDREKVRELLLSGDGDNSDSDADECQDMEVTFKPGLEDLNKRILEKKDKKSKTVWEQVQEKNREKRKARKNRSKNASSEDDSSDYDVKDIVNEQEDDFFIEEEDNPSYSIKNTQREREEPLNMEEKEREASRAELELLVAEDETNNARGYKLKPNKKVKGKNGKLEASVESKLPDVDPSEDPRFAALRTSHLYALDPTDPQFKRSAAYARQQLGKKITVKEAKETTDACEEAQINNNTVPIEKEKYELASSISALKKNLEKSKKRNKGK